MIMNCWMRGKLENWMQESGSQKLIGKSKFENLTLALAS